ncbi:hypothetical protein [Kribbella sp. NPDC004536]|uniref:hypothetical protein n=1 Tax=Kribbella sp. NPDC004536 TaxID=3364106 RepID=UPI0036811F4A
MTASSSARAALATLPTTFLDPGSVTFVDGDANWPAELERVLRSRPRGILLVHPAPVDFKIVDNLPPVVVDSPWAKNPAINNAFKRSTSRIECRVLAHPDADLATELLHQVMLIRAAVAPMTTLDVQHVSDHALYATGRTEAEVTVDLSIVRTSGLPASATLRQLTPDGSVELVLPSSETARPARLTTVGPDGAVLEPTQYESAHRASLRELHATGPAEALAELRRLQADVALTTAALGDHPAVQAPA